MGPLLWWLNVIQCCPCNDWVEIPLLSHHFFRGTQTFNYPILVAELITVIYRKKYAKFFYLCYKHKLNTPALHIEPKINLICDGLFLAMYRDVCLLTIHLLLLY